MWVEMSQYMPEWRSEHIPECIVFTLIWKVRITQSKIFMILPLLGYFSCKVSIFSGVGVRRRENADNWRLTYVVVLVVVVVVVGCSLLLVGCCFLLVGCLLLVVYCCWLFIVFFFVVVVVVVVVVVGGGSGGGGRGGGGFLTRPCKRNSPAGKGCLHQERVREGDWIPRCHGRTLQWKWVHMNSWTVKLINQYFGPSPDHSMIFSLFGKTYIGLQTD